MPYRPGEDVARILETIRNPLVFFALVTLVSESVFYLVVTKLEGSERVYLAFLMILAFFAVIAVVSYITIKAPEHLYEQVVDRMKPVVTSEVERKSAEILSQLDQRAQQIIGNFQRRVDIIEKKRELLATANDYVRKGYLTAAFQGYTTLAELEPSAAEPDIGLGAVYKRQGELLADQGNQEEAGHLYLKAKSSCDAALKKRPDYAAAYYNRSCYRALLREDVNDVLVDLGRAIQLDVAFRSLAEEDPDFSTIRDDPRFQRVLRGDVLPRPGPPSGDSGIRRG